MTSESRRPGSPAASGGRAARSSSRVRTFTYSARQRWAWIPTIAFLVFLFAVLAVRPELVWEQSRIDEQTRSAAMLLAGALAIALTAGLVMRWLEPFWIAVDPDALVGRPLIGGERRIAYDAIDRVDERPKTFMRGNVELVVHAPGARPFLVHGNIRDYGDLVRLLRARVRAEVREAWQEPADRGARG